ncbi:mitogen-activated protein kinase-binding protein 1-like isoform X4 [Lineus longissimus]|uniref:mitogen-activated protein kinase-binding protein 1-like isoform X4 n=1 Tax=Lineus longissimus TaxID=88925 RepID=UPI00315C99B3
MDRHRKIVRSPSLKRKSRPVPITERVSLEKVLGLTVTSNAALAVDPNTGTIAYPAGCVVVLFNGKKNRQSHISNTSKKTITALSFTADGKHLVTGESGHQPAVRVWDIEEKAQVGEFHGHKFGISCVAFAPNMKHIVSVGSQHDMMVNVWNWKLSCKLASNKVSSKVNGLDFSEDGSYFVTVGTRHVKFWYLEQTKARRNETVPLQGRSGILGDQRNNIFTDVACGKGCSTGRTYTITQSGLLCEFNEKRLLDKWVELRTTTANSISAGDKYIFIGCGDGIIRVFDALSLNFVITLPRPHCIGVDVAAGHDASHMVRYSQDAKFPNTLAAVVDNNNKKLTCIYNDHSLYIWDIKDIKKIGKVWSFLYHSQCVWGLEVYPDMPSDKQPALPPGSFITCSSDDTIRFWNLDTHVNTDIGLRRNIYSHDLLKVVYTDPEYTFVCNTDNNTGEKADAAYEGKNGVRSIKVSPDGQRLASGDRMGNIRLHDLNFFEELCLIEAHDGEVLSLEFSQSEKEGRPLYLSTASRDRLIHIFDVNKDFSLLNTLDDHSSSITAVRFVENNNQLQMLSCGADKTLLFRNVQTNPDSDELQLSLNHHMVGKTTLYDMDVDPTNKFVATACHDRNVRIYNVKTGKQRKCYKGSIGDDGTLVRVQLDPSGSYAATSCSDKNICIMDFISGDVVSTMYGHSEIAPGIKFMNDLKHFISVSGDGCIFVWKLHPDFTQQMRQRLAALGKISKDQADGGPAIRRGTFAVVPCVRPGTVDTNGNDEAVDMDDDGADDNQDDEDDPDYSFNIGGLPSWAKKQGEITTHGNEPLKASVPFMTKSQSHSPIWSKVLHEESDPLGPMSSLPAPRGRWAQRVDDGGIQMKSLLDNDNTLQLSFDAARGLGVTAPRQGAEDRRRFTIEPDTLSEQLQKAQIRRDTMVIERALAVHEEDGENVDDDDDDDDFFTIGASPEEIAQRFDEDGNSNISDSGGAITTSRGSLARHQTFMSRTSGPDRTPSEDHDDEDEEEEPEVVIYPTVSEEGDTAETSTDSFRVFALSAEELAARRRRNRILSTDTQDTEDSKDIESENTEPITIDEVNSDEEFVDDIPSGPPSLVTTPLDPNKQFIEDDTAKEEFLRQTFENIGASPVIPGSPASSETENGLAPNYRGRLPSHRLSLSSRFLSRAQTAHLRRLAEMAPRYLSHLELVPFRAIHAQTLAEGNCNEESGNEDHERCQDAEESSQASTITEIESHSPPTRLPKKDEEQEYRPRTFLKEVSHDEGSKQIPRATKRVSIDSKTGEPYVDPGDDSSDSESLNPSLPWQQPQMRKAWSVTDLSKEEKHQTGSSRRARASSPAPSPFVIHKVDNSPPVTANNRRRTRSQDRGGTAPVRSRSNQNLSQTGSSESPRKRPVSSYGGPPVIKPALGRGSSTTPLSKSASHTAINASASSPRKSKMKQRNRLSMPSGITSSNLTNDDVASESDQSLADSTNMNAKDSGIGGGKAQRHLPVISGTSKQRQAGKHVAGPADLKQKENVDDSSDSVSEILSASEDSFEKRSRSLDRKLMPPPAAGFVSKTCKDAFLKKAFQGKRGYSADFSRQQAKDVILGKSERRKMSECGDNTDTDSDSGKSDPEKKMTFTEKLVPGTSVSVTVSQPENGSSECIDMRDLGASPLELPVKDHSPNKDPSAGKTLGQSGHSFSSGQTQKHRNSEPVISLFGLHQSGEFKTDTSRTEQTVTLSKTLSATSVVNTALSTRTVHIGAGGVSPPDSPRKEELKASEISARPPHSPKSLRRSDTGCGIPKASDSPRTKRRSETFSGTSIHDSRDLRKAPDSPTFRRKLELARPTSPRPTSPRTKEFKDSHLPTSPRSKNANFDVGGGKTDWRQVARQRSSSSESLHSSPHSSPNKSPYSSPVKSRSGRMSPKHGHETEEEMSEACTQAVADVKKSMTKATSLYQRLSTNCKKIPREKSQEMLSILRDSFVEARAMMVSVIPGEELLRQEDRKIMVENMCQTIECLAGMDSVEKMDEQRVIEAFEPILEQYSQQLSDRVYSLVQSRVEMDLEEPERPEIETDI